MPPKAKVTREMIIDAAFMIVAYTLILTRTLPQKTQLKEIT